MDFRELGIEDKVVSYGFASDIGLFMLATSKKVCLYNYDGKIVRVISDKSNILSADVSSDCSRILVSLKNKRIKTYNILGQVLCEIPVKNKGIISISKIGNLSVFFNENNLSMWSKGGKVLCKLSSDLLGVSGNFLKICISPHGNRIFIMTHGSKLDFIDYLLFPLGLVGDMIGDFIKSQIGEIVLYVLKKPPLAKLTRLSDIKEKNYVWLNYLTKIDSISIKKISPKSSIYFSIDITPLGLGIFTAGNSLYLYDVKEPTSRKASHIKLCNKTETITSSKLGYGSELLYYLVRKGKVTIMSIYNPFTNAKWDKLETFNSTNVGFDVSRDEKTILFVDFDKKKVCLYSINWV